MTDEENYVKFDLDDLSDEEREKVMEMFAEGMKSENEYTIIWQRESQKPRPEDVRDVGGRNEAIESILNELGIEAQTEKTPSPRYLGDDLPYFEVARLAVDTIPALILLRKYIKSKNDEALVSENVKEVIDEHREK